MPSFALPVPPGVGFGAPIDVSAIVGRRAFSVGGMGDRDLVVIHASHDGASWAPVVRLPGSVVQAWQSLAPFLWLRVERVEVDPAGSPAISVSGAAGSSACVGVAVPVPAWPGVGAPVDLSATDPLRGFVVSGMAAGDRVDLDVSPDGIHFLPAASFVGAGGRYAVTDWPWLIVRARRVTVDPIGAPVVGACCQPPQAGGGGGASPPFPLGTWLDAYFVEDNVDPQGRYQLNHLPPLNVGNVGGLLRLGQNQVDGDPLFREHDGVDVWGPAPGSAGGSMSAVLWSLARIKADRYGLQVSNPAGQFYWYRVDGNGLKLRDLSNVEVLTIDLASHAWAVHRSTVIKGLPTNLGGTSIMIQGSDGIGGAAGGGVVVTGGDQIVVDDATLGGQTTVKGGSGSPAGAVNPGGTGGLVRVDAGRGGDGSATRSSGDGGSLAMRATGSGANNGGGIGASGTVIVEAAAGGWADAGFGTAARPGGTVDVNGGDGGGGDVGLAPANGGAVYVRAGAAGPINGGPGGATGGQLSLVGGAGNGQAAGGVGISGGVTGGGTMGRCQITNFGYVTIGQSLGFTGVRIGGTVAPTRYLQMESGAGGGYYDQPTHSWINGSSETVKQEIVDCAVDLVGLVDKIRVRSFRFRDEVAELGDAAALHHGFIAEEAGPPFATRDRDGQSVSDCVGILLGAVQAIGRRLAAVERAVGL